MAGSNCLNGARTHIISRTYNSFESRAVLSGVRQRLQYRRECSVAPAELRMALERRKHYHGFSLNLEKKMITGASLSMIGAIAQLFLGWVSSSSSIYTFIQLILFYKTDETTRTPRLLLNVFSNHFAARRSRWRDTPSSGYYP
jgi:hypothetical protein